MVRTANRLGGLIAALVALTSVGRAAATAASAYEIKAVILYHFAGFVTWPEASFSDSRSPMLIGIVGEDPFGPFLDDAVRGESAGGHPIAIVRFAQPRDVSFCHILFVSASADAQLDAILARIGHRPVLTVGETEGFARRGGVIRFLTADNRTRFHINLTAAKAADLVISSKLLRLAELVAPGKETK